MRSKEIRSLVICLMSLSCVPAKRPAQENQNSSDNGAGASQGNRQAANQPASPSGANIPAAGVSTDGSQPANSRPIIPTSNSPYPPSVVPNPISQLPSPTTPPATVGIQTNPTPSQTSDPIQAPTVSAPVSQDYFLFGYDTISGLYNVFLGCLTCASGSVDSVFNQYGSYGSAYSSSSINNQYSKWGSPYSTVSACNQIAFNPPSIVDQTGKITGYWSLNMGQIGRINLDALNSALMALCRE